MKCRILVTGSLFIALVLHAGVLHAQSAQPAAGQEKKPYKNIIRYNLSGPLLFGFDKYIVFGYERIINSNQSFSINFGANALPKFVKVDTDSFSLQKDVKNNGINFSMDYRFYLPRENKYEIPHGIYIGPYVSYNHFNRSNSWLFRPNTAAQQTITTETRFDIFSVGAELGYQFVLWDRMTLDMVLIGPGISTYNLKGVISSDLPVERRTELQKALKQLITQKFPGMNYVFSDKEFDASGTLRTTGIGFRYMIHIGFRF